MRNNITLATLLLAATLLHAGDGHDHGALPGAGGATAGDWITVSAAGMRNLDLQTQPASVRELHRTLPAIGIIDAAPGRSVEITSRISGQVHSLEVAEGQTVRKGQELLRILSGQPGDPPPIITMEAPRSGTVTLLHVTPGSRVSPDEHLLDIVDLDVVHVRATIHEGQIRELELGQTARVRPAGWPDSVWTGKLVRMGGELDEETGTLPAWFEVKNPRGSLRANMRAQLTILVESRKQALVIPSSAVLGDHGNRFVFVARELDHGIFERVEIVTGLEDDLGVEVLSGLTAGDVVVVRGNYSLQYLPGHGEPEGMHADDADHETGNPAHGEEGHVHVEGGHGEEGHVHDEHEAETTEENAMHAEDEHDHTGAGGMSPVLVRLLQIALGLSLVGNLWLLVRRDNALRGHEPAASATQSPEVGE
jgi:cobalt-zinc-cadmium efflux system membrane fusion protein